MTMFFSTPDELSKFAIEMEGFYGDLHTQFDIDEDYYDLNFKSLLEMPKQFKGDATILPTVREVVDAAVDHVAPGFRKVTVPRRAANDAATNQAKKLLMFYEALLLYFERSAVVSPFRETTKHISELGMGVLEIVYDKNLWGDEPVKMFGEPAEDFKERKKDWKDNRGNIMPFQLFALHPSEVMIDPFNDPPQWAIRKSEKYVGEILRSYPLWHNAQNRSHTDKVTSVEYWERLEKAVIVDNQTVFTRTFTNVDGERETVDAVMVKNKWKIIPFIVGASGLGTIDKEYNPARRFVGLIRYLRDLFRSESRNYSVFDIVLRQAAWPVRLVKGEGAEQLKGLQLEYGTWQPVGEDFTTESLTPDLPPDAVLQFMQLTNAIISSAAAPRPVRGGQESGVGTGFQHQLILNEARLRYNSIAATLERMMVEVCQKAAILLEQVVDGPISLTSHATQDEFTSISGRDINGHHAVHIKVNVVESEDDMRKQQAVANMFAVGLMSRITAITEANPNVDPEQELALILADQALQSPEVLSIFGQAAAQEVASATGLEQLITALSQAATSAGGRQTTRRPADNTGEPSGEGSRADQAAIRVAAGQVEGA